VKRVAVIFNPVTAPYAGLFWQPIEAAAPFFSVEPIQAPPRDAGAIEENDRSVCTRAEWWTTGTDRYH
jgi:hypothetical protein